MEIKKVDNQDMRQIKSLWEELNRHHCQHSTSFKAHFQALTFEERINQLESKDAVAVFVAEDKSEIIGYCMASISEHSGEVDSIFVKPNHRKRKIGERLIASAESWLEKMGATKFFVCVAEGNEHAFGFYNRLAYFQRFTVLEKMPVKKMGALGD